MDWFDTVAADVGRRPSDFADPPKPLRLTPRQPLKLRLVAVVGEAVKVIAAQQVYRKGWLVSAPGGRFVDGIAKRSGAVEAMRAAAVDCGGTGREAVEFFTLADTWAELEPALAEPSPFAGVAEGMRQEFMGASCLC